MTSLGRSGSTIRLRAILSAIIALALLLIAWGVGNASGWWHHDAPHTADGTTNRPYRVTVNLSLNGCTADWTASRAGAQVISLNNTTDRSMDVELIGTGANSQKKQPTAKDAAAAQIYSELERLGPGVTREMTTVIGPGHYHFLCLPDDAPAVSGTDVTIAKATAGQVTALPTPLPHAAPVTEQELIPVAQEYVDWVRTQLPGIEKTVEKMHSTVAKGSEGWRRSAQSQWKTAHHGWLTLGAAYDAFGDLGTDIDGTADGLPNGAADKDFTGFHRIEKDLWENRAPAEVLPHIGALIDSFEAIDDKTLEVGALDIGLRAHEISEDARRLTLDGKDDFGSHTGLDALTAENQGTQKVIALLSEILARRLPRDEFDGMKSDLKSNTDYFAELSQEHPNIAPANLSHEIAQQVRSRLGEQTEQLARIATVTDIRRAE
ncbi:EfeM/EfeO family lipoprotein [Brevibacterium sp.]|uniref:EfeM/EfeO family lipoprotein n=1 Tax=Brevibacterium sp. TaxID=1701 RepID=UPI002811B67C|nr:EfeM/EfeO family lipoprotein [Brevibacterium sp.]